MKTKNEVILPDCDICPHPHPAPYDAPLNALGRSEYHASWGNLCEAHFKKYGADTSVTLKRILVEDKEL